MADLSINFAGIKSPNPFWLASAPPTNMGSMIERAFASDPYVNALRARFGFALTCHRAQGGEWPTTIVVFEPTYRWATESYFRWVYTAITRASGRLVAVRPPRYGAPIDGRPPQRAHRTLPAPPALAASPGTHPRR